MANNSTTSLHTHFGFSSFRPGQWDAIEAVAIQNNKRALVIQRTGWMATSSPSAPVPGIGAAC
jgi:superfamily II DNA helicase RecQ